MKNNLIVNHLKVITFSSKRSLYVIQQYVTTQIKQKAKSLTYLIISKEIDVAFISIKTISARIFIKKINK
ncbi:hypothetical protein BCM0074_1614 [Bacillus cereus]|nr:hypothetical protein BCM0074_1614 [Bacillus cereus]